MLNNVSAVLRLLHIGNQAHDTQIGGEYKCLVQLYNLYKFGKKTV